MCRQYSLRDSQHIFALKISIASVVNQQSNSLVLNFVWFACLQRFRDLCSKYMVIKFWQIKSLFEQMMNSILESFPDSEFCMAYGSGLLLTSLANFILICFAKVFLNKVELPLHLVSVVLLNWFYLVIPRLIYRSHDWFNFWSSRFCWMAQNKFTAQCSPLLCPSSMGG